MVKLSIIIVITAKNLNFHQDLYKKTHSLALKLTKNNFKLINKTSVAYNGINNNFVININNPIAYRQCSCNCKYYIKDGICMHLVGYSWVRNKNLFKNYSNAPTTFAIKTKIGRHKKSAKAGDFN